MTLVKKRTLISSMAALALVAGNAAVAPAALANDASPAPDATTTADSASSVEGDAQESEASESADTAESSDTAEGEATAEEMATATSDTASQGEANTTAPATANAAVPAGDTADESTPAKPNPVWIDKGFANWDFKTSFRQYVGVENEERVGMGLVEDRLSWYPKNDQKFDTANPARVRFGGEVEWQKYYGVLHIKLSNPTVDFTTKKLYVDAYTKGTLAGGGELTVTQEPLLDMDDLAYEVKDGYIIVHSLRPRITELSQKIFGFYKGEVGAPFVATLEARQLGDTPAPQPVLSDLFPEQFPRTGNGPLIDENEPVRDIEIPDPRLRDCILADRDLKAGTPITNKVIEMVQSLACYNPGPENPKITNLQGLQFAKNLTSLRLNFNNITDLTPLAHMTWLKELSLKDNAIRDLRPLAGLAKLSRLDVSKNKITSLAGMEKMMMLDRFVAEENRITSLESLPMGSEELRVLRLENNRISSLEPVAELRWLRELNVDHNRITSLAGLDQIRGVEKFRIQNNYLTDPSHLNEWANRDHVVSIHVSKNLFTDWTLLNDIKDKVRDWPEDPEQALNPVSLEDALAADAKVDAEDPDPNANTADQSQSGDHSQSSEQAQSGDQSQSGEQAQSGDQPQSGDQSQSAPEVTYVYDGAMDWGVRSSFMRYIQMPFVGGKWELSDGATGQFTFPMREVVASALENLTSVSFGGKVHFTGHAGKLDLSIASPSIDKTDAGWKMSAVVVSRPFDPATAFGAAGGAGFRSARSVSEVAAAPQADRIVLLDLSDPQVTVNGDTATYRFATAQLTEPGRQAFGGFYRENDREMAPISLTITRSVKTEDPKTDDPKTEDPKTEDPKTEDPKTDDPKTEEPKTEDPKTDDPKTEEPKTEDPKTEDPKGDDSKPKEDKPKGEDKNPEADKSKDPKKNLRKECVVDPNKMRVTSGTLSWGVRSSFTSYVRGAIAKGGWDLNGVTWDGTDFNFPASGGLYNLADRSGTLYYSGTVHFYGHNGILDVTLSNPVVEINGNSGALYLTVSGSDMQGNKFNLGRVNFATLGFNGVNASQGLLSFDGASVTLTAEGAKAFAGFYNAGVDLAPMSATHTLTHATSCDADGNLTEYDAFGGTSGAGGTGSGLAKTGADAGVLVALSLSMLLVGAAATRRRVTR